MAGCVPVRRLNLDGDGQSDLTVHGGAEKAVYAYPSEHYAFWCRELEVEALPWGAFGENLTTEGLLEDTVRIGDRLQIGSAAFMVTQPRTPCLKLAIRFGRDDIVRRFLQSGRTGFYLRVVEEGGLTADDAISVAPAGASLTVATVARLYTAEAPEPELLRRAIQSPALSESWRDRFRQRLATAGE